ncbi:MAG: 2-aminoethylphosphonate--pyruvate transaminase [Lachnospiraceae bacterium]|nr:2-aminoethylphosphonate--pyruvate transaminase [Lachnospiraceae bacterium]
MKPVERKILLNPGPATTTDTVKYAQIVPDICPREKEFSGLMKGLQEGLLNIVHADKKEYEAVLFCGSGTLCMDVCLNSLVPEDKKVLIIDNGAYSARAAEICEYYHIPFVHLSFPVDELPDMEQVEKAFKENPDVAVVYSTHNETGTGILNPIREIGEMAHRYGAVSVVDTTSTYAMRPINVYDDNIDFCMASAQKGLMGMTGLSYVIGRREAIEASADYPTRSYYCNLFLQYSYFKKTGEMHFTPPVQTIYAAIQALKEYNEEGEQRKWERHLRVHRAILQGIDRLGFHDVIKRDQQAGLVVSVRYPDDPAWDFEKIHDYCYERGFTIYPGKISDASTFRLCALGAIDKEDIEAFFTVFEEALKAAGVSTPVKYK